MSEKINELFGTKCLKCGQRHLVDTPCPIEHISANDSRIPAAPRSEPSRLSAVQLANLRAAREFIQMQGGRDWRHHVVAAIDAAIELAAAPPDTASAPELVDGWKKLALNQADELVSKNEYIKHLEDKLTAAPPDALEPHGGIAQSEPRFVTEKMPDDPAPAARPDAASALEKALRDIVEDLEARWDMNDPRTNPGIKQVVEQAHAALRSTREGTHD